MPTTPFPFVRETIALRALEPGDAPLLQRYLNHPALAGRRYLPDGVSDVAPLSLRQVEGVIEQWQKDRDAWTLAVLEAACGTVAGHVRAEWEWDPHTPSVSVVISPDHQRRGLGSAALDLALRFLFEETPAHAVSMWIASWNEEAVAFARRNGFSEAGRSPRGGVHGGRFYSQIALDLLRREWRERQVNRAT